MLDRNNLFLGIGIGLVVPLVGYAVFLMLSEQIANAQWLEPESRGIISFRQRTLAVFAICLNLIPFRFYQKRWAESTMRGIIIATFVFIAFWIYWFGSGLYS